MRVVVVGCGVVGSFVAWILRRRGVDIMCVSLPKKIPHVGLIQSIMQKFREDIEMAYRTRKLYHEVASELDLSGFYRVVKSYTVIHRDRLEAIKSLVEVWRSYGVEVRELDDLREVPFRVYDSEVVLYSESDYLVRIDLLLAYMWRELGVVVDRAEIKLSDGRPVVLTEHKKLRLEPDVVVVACGAYTRSLLARAGLRLPLIPYKCQAGVFILSTSTDMYILYDYVNRIYVRPALHPLARLANKISPRCKLMIAGDGNTPPLEPDEHERRVEKWFIDEMIPKLRKRFKIARFVLGRADFCDTTPDAKPLVAKLGNIVVVSGFDGYGVEVGPAIAQIAAKLVLGEKLDDYEVKYLADRFTGREDISRLPEAEAHEL